MTRRNSHWLLLMLRGPSLVWWNLNAGSKPLEVYRLKQMTHRPGGDAYVQGASLKGIAPQPRGFERPALRVFAECGFKAAEGTKMHASNDNARRPSSTLSIKLISWQQDIFDTLQISAANRSAPSGFAAILAAVQAATTSHKMPVGQP
jgi:hypothetical protein